MKIVYKNLVEEEILLDAGAQLERAFGPWRPTREWVRSEATCVYSLEPAVGL